MPVCTQTHAKKYWHSVFLYNLWACTASNIYIGGLMWHLFEWTIKLRTVGPVTKKCIVSIVSMIIIWFIFSRNKYDALPNWMQPNQTLAANDGGEHTLKTCWFTKRINCTLHMSTAWGHLLLLQSPIGTRAHERSPKRHGWNRKDKC